MRLIKMHGAHVELEITTSELVVLDNALNEVCHTSQLDDFEASIGADRETALALLEELGSIVDQRDPHTNSD